MSRQTSANLGKKAHFEDTHANLHHDHSQGGHHHDHALPDKLTTSFVLGIILNLIMVLVGAGVGFWSHSLALLSDAGHNLSDVACLVLAFWGLKLSKVKANSKYTYGYKKITILTSLANAILLIGVTSWIIVEAFERIMLGVTAIPGLWVSLVAFLGIIINSFSALLFIKQKDSDLNVKGAYLHMASDALVSLAVVIAGILIFFTHWFWLDPVISVFISALVLWATWGLLSQSLRLSLDGVPKEMDLQTIQVELNKIKGIKEAHHLHVWALSTNEFALTAHLVLDKDLILSKADSIKLEARHILEHFKIKHATLEIESETVECLQIEC